MSRKLLHFLVICHNRGGLNADREFDVLSDIWKAEDLSLPFLFVSPCPFCGLLVAISLFYTFFLAFSSSHHSCSCFMLMRTTLTRRSHRPSDFGLSPITSIPSPLVESLFAIHSSRLYTSNFILPLPLCAHDFYVRNLLPFGE